MCIEFIANVVIRPPRRTYSFDSLEPVMHSNGEPIQRTSISFRNSIGLTIFGSFYKPAHPAPGNPTVIYLHGNSSNQLEGRFIPPLVCQYGISVLCIDTSGSGNSGGEYISLGLNERDDVAAAIDFLRSEMNVEEIILWGRSMGASLAIWCAEDGMDISGIIVDSPYESVTAIIEDLTKRSKCLWLLSKILRPFVDWKLRRTVGFDTRSIDITANLSRARVPVMFIHAENDTFINIRETHELFTGYRCQQKTVYATGGNHNSPRNSGVIHSAVNFIMNTFGIVSDTSVIESTVYESMQKAPHYEDVVDLMGNM